MGGGSIIVSTDYASIEIDKENQHTVVKAKKTIGTEEIADILKVLSRETNTRALDLAADWTMKINYKKEEEKK